MLGYEQHESYTKSSRIWCRLKLVTAANEFMYGNFIGALINFLIIAFIMFMVVKGMNAMKKAEPAPAPAGPTSYRSITC
jgi:large-conductance mechanosensitive channel